MPCSPLRFLGTADFRLQPGEYTPGYLVFKPISRILLIGLGFKKNMTLLPGRWPGLTHEFKTWLVSRESLQLTKYFKYTLYTRWFMIRPTGHGATGIFQILT